MSAAYGMALAGFNASAKRIAIRAENIVNLQTRGYKPLAPAQISEPGGPIVRARPVLNLQENYPGADFFVPNMDLETEFTDVLLSKTAYKASASLMRTARETDNALLDVLV